MSSTNEEVLSGKKRTADSIVESSLSSQEASTVHEKIICSPSGARAVVKAVDIPTEKKVATKREDPIKWDDYFMAIAFLSAMRSKDPSTQVGACIVNPDKRIVGMGYNGFPRGCSDDELPWCRHAENELDTKYPYVCHAEVNAILNKNTADVRGCSIYVALFPCNECAKLIIQSGITEVVYLSDKYKDTPSMQASRRMMTMAGLVLRQFTPSQKSISIDFSQVQPSPSL